MAEKEVGKKKAMRLKFDAKLAKQGAKVAGLALVGVVAAKLGGRLATRVSSGVAAYAARSTSNNAIVELVSGGLIDVALLVVAAKVMKSPAKAAAMAPFLIGGTALGSFAPLVQDRVVGALDDGLSRILPRKADELPAAAGMYADVDRGLAGELSRGGGLYADVDSGLAGELSRAGGLYPEDIDGAFIGGELRARRRS